MCECQKRPFIWHKEPYWSLSYDKRALLTRPSTGQTSPALLPLAYLLIARASASWLPSSSMALTVLSISSRADAVKYAEVSKVT